MNIEAKRIREDDDHPLVAAFARYRDQYAAALGIRSVAALHERVDKKEETMKLTLTPETGADFAYLSVFPALRTLVMADTGDSYEDQIEGMDHEEADAAITAWLDSHPRIVLGGGIDQTSVTSLTVVAYRSFVELGAAMAPSVGKLEKLWLNATMRFRADAPLPAFSFSALRELSIGTHYSINYDVFLSDSGSLAWCGTVPTLWSLRLENVEPFWYEGDIAPDTVFPNLKQFTLYYCNEWIRFPKVTMSKLETLTLYHTNIHSLEENTLSESYPALKDLDWDEDENDQVDEEAYWNHQHYYNSRLWIDGHPTLQSIVMRNNREIGALTLRGNFPALERIDLNHSTGELHFQGATAETTVFHREDIPRGDDLDVATQFPRLARIKLRKERGDFLQDIFSLPALVKYSGPLYTNTNEIGDAHAVDSPYHRALFMRLVNSNPTHMLISDVYGVANVPPPLQALYNVHKKKYAIAGFPTLVSLLRFLNTNQVVISLPFHRTLLTDFAYLSFFGPSFTKLRIDDNNQVLADGQSPIPFTLGPGLSAVMPQLNRLYIVSQRHVLRDVNDDCLSGSAAVNVLLRCRVQPKRVLSICTFIADIGMDDADSEVSRLVLPIANAVIIRRATDLPTMDLATSMPDLQSLVLVECALAEVPTTWRSPFLKALKLRNVALTTFPKLGTRFPNLLNLSVKNAIGSTTNLAAFGDVRIAPATYPQGFKRIKISNVPILSLTTRRSRNNGRAGLAEIVLKNAEMFDAPPATLHASMGITLSHVTWNAFNGYMPLIAIKQYGTSVVTNDQVTLPFRYSGTFLLDPAMLQDGVFDLDEFRRTGAEPTTPSAETTELFNLLVDANPGMIIRSAARDQWVAQNTPLLPPPPARTPPYFVAFRHHLVCRRNETLNALSAALAYDAVAVELWAALEGVELLDDEGVEHTPAAAEREAAARSRLDAAVAALNAHPTAGITEAAVSFGTFRAVLDGTAMSFGIVSPYFDTDCILCANRFYRPLETDAPLSTDNNVLLAHQDQVARVFVSSADGRARGPLVTCNFTRHDCAENASSRAERDALAANDEAALRRADAFICGEHSHWFHALCYAHTLLSQSIAKRCPFSSKAFHLDPPAEILVLPPP